MTGTIESGPLIMVIQSVWNSMLMNMLIRNLDLFTWRLVDLCFRSNMSIPYGRGPWYLKLKASLSMMTNVKQIGDSPVPRLITKVAPAFR